MSGTLINGLLLILWLAIWGFGGPLFLPAMLISLVGMVLCAAIEGLS